MMAVGPAPIATLHAELRLARFLFMHAVILSRSGTSSPHSRITSGVHACCISGVPGYCAFAPEDGQAIIESKVPATTAAVPANLATDFFAHCAIWPRSTL
jgi:hypothetical protein